MTTTSSTSTIVSPAPDVAQSGRLLSVDVLRGLTIGFMILVNNNGNEAAAYWPLKHAAWNGFTPTDLVFPTFLFLVGITTVFSTASRLAKGDTKQRLFLHVLRRSIVLYLLGLVVNSFPYFHLHTMRFYGVLPRIAICYLITASLYIVSADWRNKAALAVAALAGYWILMRFVPAPDTESPVMTFPCSTATPISPHGSTGKSSPPPTFTNTPATPKVSSAHCPPWRPLFSASSPASGCEHNEHWLRRVSA